MSRAWEGGTGLALKEGVTNGQSDLRSQALLLARQCQQAAAVPLSAHLGYLALIQRSLVLVNSGMVHIRQSSTKAIPISLSGLFEHDGNITSAEDKHTGGYCIDYLQSRTRCCLFYREL